ncbi:MAG: hypothetical protein RBU35_04740 [Anaerolineae bacterium]|nr:hypothetical protein [Anaerolineae bacterium]
MRGRASTVLALALLAGGLALVAGGLFAALRPGGLAALGATPLFTATPQPTLTEPILPPPPTGTLSPTASPPPAVVTSSTPGTTAAVSTAAPLPSPEEDPATLVPRATGSSTPLPSSPASPTPAPTPLPSPLPATPTTAPPSLYSLRERVGLGSGGQRVTAEIANLLGFGWYLDWAVRPAGFRSAGVSYMPMIRLKDGQIHPSGDALLAAVDALPGALWLIGNEPDVKWQDSVTAEAYAEVYHGLYALLKGRDPTCQVAIGGVSQPTPLRLRYLDRILEVYRQRYGQEMPVDVWNVHNFVLREERGSWGVDIPPGMDDAAGRLYEIGDHDDLDLFRRQLVEFRRWMKERGQQNKPLIVTEYGILMPNEYGFPPEAVRQFMLGTFEIMRTLRDPTLGYPADGDRLVQRWCWFSLQDDRYPTGDLFDPNSGRLTFVGEAFARYTQP